MPGSWTKILPFLCLLFAFSMAPARAEEPVTTPPLDLSGEISESELEAMLGRLSDEQVREILISEFAARRDASPEPDRELMSLVRDIGDRLRTNTEAVFSKWPEMGDAFAAVSSRLSDDGGVGIAFLVLIGCGAVGVAVRHFWRRRASRRQVELAERNVDKGSFGTLGTIGDASVFLLIELSSAIAFAVTAIATLYLFFDSPDLRTFVSSGIAFFTIVLIVRSVIHFMFPLDWPIYRLVAISDGATRLVHRVVIGLAALWMFEDTAHEVLAEFGAPEGTPALFSIILSFIWLPSVLTGIFTINRATSELLPDREATGLANALARNWAFLMAVAQVMIWMIFTGGSLVSGDSGPIAANVFWTLIVLIVSWTVYRIVVHYLRAKSLDPAISDSILRAMLALQFTGGSLIVLAIWGLNPATLAAGGTLGQVVQAIINVALTAIIGWAIWDFVRTIIDIRTAAETPNSDDDDAVEGEGGLGVSRAATLLPLLRSVALAAIGLTCLFTALSSLGVNVGPLIAGAGVLGLAIGFGAQTLVKDVVSGVFFLIDDAFRRGEYIDLGSVKGTVERISVRSLQLRHHLGAVHTIPFGDIAALTNYSRDWVIMKLPLRLTFDTDPQKVKKIVKQIGAEFMENETISDGLIEPPKSQGVIQMEDSAMILRVKFKAVPGKQFVIRRELLHRIRAAFEEAGIRFANREVTVRVNEGATASERQEAINAAATRAAEAEQPAS